jgi:hypothetical protein
MPPTDRHHHNAERSFEHFGGGREAARKNASLCGVWGAAGRNCLGWRGWGWGWTGQVRRGSHRDIERPRSRASTSVMAAPEGAGPLRARRG